MQRLLQNTKLNQQIAPASRSAGTVNGTAVDASLYTEASLLVDAGAIASATTLDVTLQHSEDGSTNWNDISGAAIVQLTAGAGGLASIGVNLALMSNKRKYLRASAVVGGSSTAVYGVSLLLAGAEVVPVVNSPASVIVK